MTQELTHCQTLLDLDKHPQGRKTWALYGCPCDMVFDLYGSSNPSRLVYDHYRESILT
ncbi:MAG: hypothetical protein FWH27_04240 [Planctomycetaceae bacterium]|nr:hypothetical protein [Planctomycetaceae bacterium]